MKRMIGLCCLLVVTCSFIIGCDKGAAPAAGDKAAAPAAGDKAAAPAADEHK